MFPLAFCFVQVLLVRFSEAFSCIVCFLFLCCYCSLLFGNSRIWFFLSLILSFLYFFVWRVFNIWYTVLWFNVRLTSSVVIIEDGITVKTLCLSQISSFPSITHVHDLFLLRNNRTNDKNRPCQDHGKHMHSPVAKDIRSSDHIDIITQVDSQLPNEAISILLDQYFQHVRGNVHPNFLFRTRSFHSIVLEAFIRSATPDRTRETGRTSSVMNQI